MWVRVPPAPPRGNDMVTKEFIDTFCSEVIKHISGGTYSVSDRWTARIRYEYHSIAVSFCNNDQLLIQYSIYADPDIKYQAAQYVFIPYGNPKCTPQETAKIILQWCRTIERMRKKEIGKWNKTMKK